MEEIIPDGPAAKSKLHAADVITAVDGKAVATSQQLKDEIRAKKIGTDVTLDIYRKAPDGYRQADQTHGEARRVRGPNRSGRRDRAERRYQWQP